MPTPPEPSATALVGGVMRSAYGSAVASAQPGLCVPPHLPPPPRGRTVVVGVGKAAAAMAQAVEDHWSGPLSGVVVVPPGAVLPLRQVRVLEGSHPVPDARSVLAGQALLAAVAGLGPEDLVIALVSGGGSALCTLPIDGVSLADKQAITQALLLRGASIAEINTVRRHLSAIKGGRLAAAAHPAQVVTLLVSDIPGDDPALIASGPTLADTTTCQDALGVLERYGVNDLPAVALGLAQGRWESVKPADPRLSGHTHRVVASAWTGLQAAAETVRRAGWPCHILSDAVEGEAREVAKVHAALALSVAQRGAPFAAPCVLLSGGEATVTVRGGGRGGRNTEFVLALALALEGRPEAHRVWGLSAGTDGLDGRAGAAGAWTWPGALAQARLLGHTPLSALDGNDSATLLAAVDGLVVTGPTHTNINDIRIVVVGPPQA